MPLTPMLSNNDSNKDLTIEQLKEHKLFRLLTDKEKVWVLEWIANGGNTVEATQKAFDVGSEASAKTMSRRLLARPQIEAVINLWYGVNPGENVEDMKEILWEIAKNKDNRCGNARIQALRLIAEIDGLVVKGAKSQKASPVEEDPFAEFNDD